MTAGAGAAPGTVAHRDKRCRRSARPHLYGSPSNLAREVQDNARSRFGEVLWPDASLCLRKYRARSLAERGRSGKSHAQSGIPSRMPRISTGKAAGRGRRAEPQLRLAQSRARRPLIQRKQSRKGNSLSRLLRFCWSSRLGGSFTADSAASRILKPRPAPPRWPPEGIPQRTFQPSAEG